MRVEQLHYFLLGASLSVLVWLITRRVSVMAIRQHLRAVFCALGLGFIVVPGHGEFIAAPLLAVLRPPLRPNLLALGGIFLLIWWATAFAAITQLPEGKWPRAKLRAD